MNWTRLFRDTPKRDKQSRWALMRYDPIEDIHNPGDIYLARYRVVQTPWFAVYIHNIRRPDNDRGTHDHPFNFASYILRGGYVEYRPPMKHDGPRRRGRATLKWHGKGRWNKLRAEDAHQITHVEPNTWTLVLCGRRRREWGFYVDGPFGVEWVHWKQYIEQVKFERKLEASAERLRRATMRKLGDFSVRDITGQ